MTVRKCCWAFLASGRVLVSEVRKASAFAQGTCTEKTETFRSQGACRTNYTASASSLPRPHQIFPLRVHAHSKNKDSRSILRDASHFLHVQHTPLHVIPGEHQKKCLRIISDLAQTSGMSSPCESRMRVITSRIKARVSLCCLAMLETFSRQTYRPRQEWMVKKLETLTRNISSGWRHERTV